MPIHEYECLDCGARFELMFIMALRPLEQCPKCRSLVVERTISMPHIRMDADVIKKSLPDPSPPLEELRGKNKPGCEGGYADKPAVDPQLKNYKRTKDKMGNNIWEEKRKTHFDMGGK